MKKLLIVFAFLPFLFLFIQCEKKEGENCHKNFSIKNTSKDTVMIGLPKYANQYKSCGLSMSKMSPNHTYSTYSSKNCLEDDLSDGKTINLYIVDKNHYKETNSWYDCDSLEIYNTILKKYELTLKDLQDCNFVVSYP